MINASPTMIAMPRIFSFFLRFRLAAAKIDFDVLLGSSPEFSTAVGAFST